MTTETTHGLTWTEKEIAQHRKAWIDALRSGDYVQRRYGLRGPASAKGEEHSHCVLGVACELAPMGRWVGDSLYQYGPPNDDASPPFTTERSATMLLDVLIEYYGLEGPYAYVHAERLKPETLERLTEECLRRGYDSEAVFRKAGLVNLSTLNDFRVGFDFLADLMEEGLEEIMVRPITTDTD